MSSNETTTNAQGLNSNIGVSQGGGGVGGMNSFQPGPNSRAQGVGYYSSISSQNMVIGQQQQFVQSSILGGNIIPYYDSAGGGGPGPGGGAPPNTSGTMHRTGIEEVNSFEYVIPGQPVKIKGGQTSIQVTRKRSSVMNHYPPPLPPQTQQHQMMTQQQQQALDGLNQLMAQPSPHARRQSPVPLNVNLNAFAGAPQGTGKMSAHQQYIHQMMQANGIHPSLMQMINNQTLSNQPQQQPIQGPHQMQIPAAGAGGVLQTLSSNQKQHQQLMMHDQSIPSPKIRPPQAAALHAGLMNITLNSGSTIEQQFVNMKNSGAGQNTTFMKRTINPPGVQQSANPFGNVPASSAKGANQYRQRSLPYQSTANGIAGILGNQIQQVEVAGGDPGESEAQGEHEMNQSVIIVEETQTTRTDMSQSSPMKAFRQQNAASQIVMGAPASSSTVNSSVVSTAISSQYNKRKVPAPPVTVSQAQIQPSPNPSKAPVINQSFVQQAQPQQVKAISSATIAPQVNNIQPTQAQSQPPQQQLIIITVSNSQPNASGGVQKKLPQNLGPGASGSTNDHKDPKQSLLMSIQEVVRLVIQRSEDINLLRQIVDLKTKKLKSKYTDSSFFYNQLQREWQRQSVEGYHLNKTANFRVEDKSPLIKTLQKQVKKMLKPFNRRRPNEDYLYAEVHLSEVMMAQETESINSYNFQQQLQNSSTTSLLSASEMNLNSSVLEQPLRNQNPPGYLNQQVYPPAQYKDLRKRNVRIIQASFKEQLVDPHVALAICIQYSRQAFFDELLDYFMCVHDLILAGTPGTIPSNCNLQTENFNYQNLKKVITKARQQSRVQISLQKKLDKVYKVLFEANNEILKQINIYRERFNEQRKKLHSKSMLLDASSQIKKQHSSLSPAKVVVFQAEVQAHAFKHNQSFTVSQEVTSRTFISSEKAQESKRTPGPHQQMAAPQPPQPSTTPVTMSETQMNSTMSNFGTINKASIQMLRGQSRGNSKLQPIIVPRNEIILKNQSVIESSNNVALGDGTPMHNAGDSLNRTIKKVNQLPALGSNQALPMPGGDLSSILGTPITNKTLSRRAVGLEPLPADHQITLEAKVAAFKHHGDSQSMSPLKRRNKIVIQGGLSKLGLTNGEGDCSGGSPLIKVFQSSSQVGGSQLHQMGDFDSESVSSYQNRPDGGTASRKVIKATITIPLPKADLGGIKFKSSKQKQLQNDDSDNSLEDQDSGSDQGNNQRDVEGEEVESPNISMGLKDSSFINNTIVATASLLNQPMSSMSSVRQSSSQSKRGKGSFFNYQNQANSLYPPPALSPIPSNPSQLYFQRMMLDMSQFPVNDRFDSLFSRYFNKKGIMAFVLNHRAKVIQRFFRRRIQYKLAAKALIVKRFRFFVARQQRVHLFATKLFITVTQKKAVRAIERAYIRYRDRLRSTLVKPGNAKGQIINKEAILQKYRDHVVKVIKIQRYFRKRLAGRFSHGRKLVKRKEMFNRLMHDWQQARYLPLAPYESQILHNEIQFMHYRQYIDEYVFTEQENYVQTLFQYDQGLVQAVEKSFKEREWEYNKQNREWSNDRIPFTFKSLQDTKVVGQAHPALQYMIDTNRRLVMTGPYQGLEDIQGVSEALTGLLAVELRNQRTEMLGKIKRLRVSNLVNPPENPPFKRKGGMLGSMQ